MNTPGPKIEDNPGGYSTAGPQMPVWPAVTFRCAECSGPLGHDSEMPDQLACGDARCSAVGMPIAVWRAQRMRVRRGEDVPAPGPGWPRPVLGGRAHPWVTPVSDGMPWWTLLDGARQVRAQDAWLCQVCGHPLGKAALVVLKHKQNKVLSDTGLHHHCLDLSAVVCPHLSTTRTAYTVAEVTRGDLRADGRPLPPVRPHAVEDDGHLWTPAWTLPDLAAARTCPLDQYRPPAVTLRPPGTPVTDTTTPTAYTPDPTS